MNYKVTDRQLQRGLSLLELMVSVAIFAILTIAVFSLYIRSNENFNQDERAARLQENGRYALNAIANDLIMSDFWGEMINPETITSSVGAGSASDDCNAALENPQSALLYYKHDSGLPMFDPTGCNTKTGGIKANTNVLVVKRTSTTPDTTPSDGVVYLRSNGFSGVFRNDAQSNPPSGDFEDWAYIPHMYFIRDDDGPDNVAGNADDVPYLCRANLVNAEFATEQTPTAHGTGNMDFDVVDTDCMAEGIEQIHIEFGIDTDDDGVANQYELDPTAAELETVTAVRVYLLVRSERADSSYTNTKSYNLGHLAAINVNDNFYRRVFSTTVALRNPIAYALLDN